MRVPCEGARTYFRTVTVAVLSLGTNLGDRFRNMRDMTEGVKRFLSQPVLMSRLMETEPVGVGEAQQEYLNRLVRGEFMGSAHELLSVCQRVEGEMGRKRPFRWAPRTADIDILLFGSECIAEPDLQIPHPRMLQRRFCVEGLIDVAPDMSIPGTGQTPRRLFERMPEEVRRQEVAFVNEPTAADR